MAGIGITLRKLVADQSYLQGAAAYLSSGIISAGPWLISVISLALLQWAVTAFLTPDDRVLLFATITYAFVGGSIVTGPIQIVLTRTIADHIFRRDIDAVAPTFTQTMLMSVVILAVVMIPFLLWAPFDIAYRLLAASLFMTVSLIWLVLAVISAAEDYVSLIFAFLIGYAVSGGAMVWLGRVLGLVGALEGFGLGQAVCLGLLMHRIYREFSDKGDLQTPLSSFWREYWILGVIGFLYYVGLWAEKLIYWFSPAGVVVHGFYRTFPAYDSMILLAYLLTIPASAVFLVNVETDFYQHFRAFYGHILKNDKPAQSWSPHGTFEQITRARLAMIASARSGLWTLVKVQGMIALFACLLAPDLASLIGLPEANLMTLRVAILAASGQVFVLYVMLLLLYLDARHQTLAVMLVFAGANVSLTALFARLAPGVYGAGYLLSTLITTLLGLHQLSSRLARLDYITFMLQPIEPAR